MLQPFEPLKLIYLQKLVQLRKFLLVSQTYHRAADHFTGTAKQHLLFSDYSDEGLAKIHFNAVRHDKYAAILDLRKPAHYNKIADMLTTDSQYLPFWAVVRSTADLEKRINTAYKDNMRAYIKQHTTWRIGGGETIKPALAVIFGELFITLKYAGQTLKIKFSDIEEPHDFREDINKKSTGELTGLLLQKEEEWMETNQDVMNANTKLKEEILYIKTLLEFRSKHLPD